VTESDHLLLDRIRRGDQAAFDTLFRAYYPLLVGFADAILRDRASAEDVVQEVMLELWRRREALAIDGSVRSYLFRATRNRALNTVRHDRIVREAEPFVRGPEAAPATQHQEVVAAETDAALVRAIAALPEPVRQVLELSRTNGLTYAEIAGVLGIAIKTVEARMGKALKALRAALDDDRIASERKVAG
jgi:RNA polymerase sigma-70 factor (ECF subfamily)